MDWPRVSTVLRAVGLGPDLSMVPAATLDRAIERGLAVHAHAEALAYGYLDDADVRPEHAPYVDAVRKFWTESGAEHIKSEFLVRHPAWQYIGHPDTLLWLGGVRTLIDLKTGDPTGGQYQVAAYIEAHNAEHPTERVTAGAVLHVREDGTYRFKEVDLESATQTWLAAMVVYRAQTR